MHARPVVGVVTKETLCAYCAHNTSPFSQIHIFVVCTMGLYMYIIMLLF